MNIVTEATAVKVTIEFTLDELRYLTKVLGRMKYGDGYDYIYNGMAVTLTKLGGATS
jgi:hypothetical protein